MLLLSFERVLLLSTASPPRYRGRCWAAIRLSRRPEPSGRVVHEEVDGLDSGGRHGRRFVLRRTHRPHICWCWLTVGSWIMFVVLLNKPFRSFKYVCIKKWTCKISARFHSLTEMSGNRNDQDRKVPWPKRPDQNVTYPYKFWNYHIFKIIFYSPLKRVGCFFHISVKKYFFHISVTASFPVAPPTVDESYALFLFLIICQNFWESELVKPLYWLTLVLFIGLSIGSQCILLEFFSALSFCQTIV